MAGSSSRSRTYVANASGSTLRVYYCTDKLTLEEMDIDTGMTLGGSMSKGPTLSMSMKMEMIMKRDKRVRYLRIPHDNHGQILGEGDIYVTVFVEQKGGSDERLNISQNFFIPSDRSFIVTADRNIVLQSYGANIWVDESGVNHRI